MMAVLKWLLTLALTVPLAFAGWLLARDPGRLSVRAWGWQIDTTLVLALILAAVLTSLSLLCYWLLWRLPRRLLGQRRQSLLVQFHQGLEDLAGGRYAKARRRLIAASTIAENAPLALLSAASAAAQLGDQADALILAERAQRYPAVKTAAEILAIQLRLEHGDLSQLDVLTRMSENAEHPLPAEVLARQLSARGRAREALAVLGKLGKHGRGAGQAQAGFGVSNSAATDWAAMVRLALKQACTPAALTEVWDLLSETEREQQDVIATYVSSAIRLGMNEVAEASLQAALKRTPSELLWQEYAELADHLSDSEALTALKFLEKSLEKTAPSESPAALLAAAKLSRKQGLSAKAAQYLARSLALAPSSPGFREQGELLLANGDHLGAAQAWRQALILLDA